jgi:hypothetical protein
MTKSYLMILIAAAAKAQNAAQNAAAKIAAELAARGQTAVESVAQEENMSISASQRYAIMQKLARQEVRKIFNHNLYEFVRFKVKRLYIVITGSCYKECSCTF